MQEINFFMKCRLLGPDSNVLDLFIFILNFFMVVCLLQICDIVQNISRMPA